MKKLPFVQPLVQRWRDEASESGAAAVPGRRPFRRWMSGSLAVVMAAMIPMRSMAELDGSEVRRVLRHSRYTVGETLHRIEVAVLSHGLSILARMPGSRAVLVLGSSVGGTLVVMDEADSRPAMPLSLVVFESPDGGADVMIGSTSNEAAADDWYDLPASVVDDLRALPGVVDRALS